MENMMLILLLITTSKCSKEELVGVKRHLTHCYDRGDDGRCTSCDNGYYGPTCSSKCIGECDYGCDMDTGLCDQCKDTYYTKSCMVKCSETCDGQLCNRTTGECTNGCVKGHCSAFCKTPCDESCKDKECDFESCKCQRCNDGLVCKEDTEGPNCTQCVKNSSNVNPTEGLVCLKRNKTHCYHQEADGRCTSCDNGYYGPTCSSKCIGECDYGCDMDTGLCDQCKDTYFTKSCMVKCPETCDGQLCNRTTGECTNGCVKGHCSAFCKTSCDESCKDKECDFESCKCQRCNDGLVCKEAAEGPNCTQCVKNISVSTRDLLNTLLLILGMILIIGLLAANATLRRGFLKFCGQCKMGHAPRQDQELLPRHMDLEQMFESIPEDMPDSEATVAMGNRDKNQEGYSYPYDYNRVKLEKGEYINASHVDGDYVTRRYIATQQPVDKTQNDFWTMAWKYQTKVIVWLTSKQTSEFDRHLQNQKGSRTYGNIRIRHVKQNKETKCNCRINKLKIKHVKKKNEAERDVTLYQFCGWFQEKSFCDFVMKVREDPNYETSPIVVFSKDGEGPTAVFLALDRYIDKTTRKANFHVDDLFVGVNDIARHRRGMFANKENIERIVKCHGHLKLLQGSIQPSQVPSEESTTKIICHGGFVFFIVVYFISAIAIILHDHVG